MGDPKFQRKTYSTPRHPWEKTRIDEERIILSKYGLKNKRELWKAQSLLDSYRTQARFLQAQLRTGNQVSVAQFQMMIRKLNRYKILGENATLDDVLSLSLESILERRFQNLVYRKHLASTQKQARQLITHGHILLNGRRVSIPGLMVEATVEDSISYDPRSVLVDEDHPLRRVIAGETGPSEEEASAEPEGEVEEKEEAKGAESKDE
ncbi:MAG: 30S ribosomal protein S4 [Candidatus Thermoplasmatota archaeon]|jgi:small subunit ribosomal protein S4|nr:30S ribosomal protein S4 [Candidatus Thermoplasmatota archaeon]MCL5794160.1 30S ribosomal protein S4 [Candidatus Thermoplasmatota archaeon]